MSPHTPETREALRAAARWLALLDSGDASEADLLRLAQWRASSPLHEDAWQKASLLRQRFTALPGALAMATLDRPDAGRRALLKQALAIAALLPTAWLVSRELPLDAWTADMHTSVGERRQVLLSDGTFVQLNTDSAVDIDLRARRLHFGFADLAEEARPHALHQLQPHACRAAVHGHGCGGQGGPGDPRRGLRDRRQALRRLEDGLHLEAVDDAARRAHLHLVEAGLVRREEDDLGAR